MSNIWKKMYVNILAPPPSTNTTGSTGDWATIKENKMTLFLITRFYIFMEKRKYVNWYIISR